MKAKAAVAVDVRRVEFMDVTVPEPGPHDVVLRVTHSWISNGTEGSFIRGERIAGDTPWSETDPKPFPHVSGYQKVGVVESAPAGCGLEAGETVMATMGSIEGMFYPFAGHVSPSITHVGQCWKIPAEMDPVAFSGMVLTQVGYNQGIRPVIGPGDACVVIGDGMVGHWAAQTMRWRGARVLMLGKHPRRMSLLATGIGDRVVDITQEEAVEAVRAWAPEGVQALADTVGTVPMITSLLPCMRHDSHISSTGFYGPRGQIDIQQLRQAEITLHCPSGWSTPRMNATRDLISAGHITTLPLITHHFPADQAGAAFDLVLGRQEHVLGVVLDWEGIA